MTRTTTRALFAAASLALLIASPVTLRAEVSVSEQSNALLCKGEQSCAWLKQACATEGGAYIGGELQTGKCDFPGQPGLKLAADRKLTPRKPAAASMTGQ